MNWRDLGERAIWTFVQGALAVGGYEAMVVGELDALRAAYIGGAAAVLSAGKTIARGRLADLKAKSDT